MEHGKTTLAYWLQRGLELDCRDTSFDAEALAKLGRIIVFSQEIISAIHHAVDKSMTECTKREREKISTAIFSISEPSTQIRSTNSQHDFLERIETIMSPLRAQLGHYLEILELQEMQDIPEMKALCEREFCALESYLPATGIIIESSTHTE